MFVHNTLVEPQLLQGAFKKKQAGRSLHVQGGRLLTLASRPPIVVGSGFAGSLEEIYLKNVSTELREAYVYTDNVRPNPADRVHLFDFSTEQGPQSLSLSHMSERHM